MIEIKNLQDLEGLIKNNVTENLNLEYKSARSLSKDEKAKSEISKDVSSMANSAGGTIIYGIKEFDDSQKKHLPEKIDDIDGNEFSKEWLEQIINSMISPKINGITIVPMYSDELNNRVSYVVNIPQSETAHQAKDKRYYKRRNFSSEPMEDYEIRDIMNRSKNPVIDLEFKIIKNTYYNHVPLMRKTYFEEDEKTDLTLYIYQVNIGNILAKFINYTVEIPNNILEDFHSNKKIIDGFEYAEIQGDNTVRDIVGGTGLYFKPNYGTSRYNPILPSLKSRAKEVALKVDTIRDEKFIFWKIHADNASSRLSKIKLNEIEYEEIEGN